MKSTALIAARAANCSFFEWAEKAAKQNEVRIITPVIGEPAAIDKPVADRSWW